MDKAAIHHACMVKQQHLIADFEKEIASLKKEMFTHDVSQSQGDSGAVERNELLVRYENELIFPTVLLLQDYVLLQMTATTSRACICLSIRKWFFPNRLPVSAPLLTRAW